VSEYCQLVVGAECQKKSLTKQQLLDEWSQCFVEWEVGDELYKEHACIVVCVTLVGEEIEQIITFQSLSKLYEIIIMIDVKLNK
jgi:hypothetical protein